MATTQERFAEHRRQRQQRRRRWLQGIVLVISLVLLVRGVAYSPWLAFAQAEVAGAQQLERAEILAIAGLQEPFNLLAADPAAIARHLTNDLRIESAHVARQYPATLTIKVKERRVAVYVRHKLGIAQVDANGMILTLGKAVRDAKAPLVTGTALDGGYIGDTAAGEHPVAVLAAFVGRLDPWTAGQLSELQVLPNGTAQAITMQGVPSKLGPLAQASDKAELADTVVRQIVPISHQVAAVDLTFSRPYITVKK